MAITATRLNRLERENRTCKVCESWPSEIALTIVRVVVKGREEAKKRRDEPSADDPEEPWIVGGQWINCPSCGRKPPQVAHIELVKATPYMRHG
jgi:hypothetical protein